MMALETVNNPYLGGDTSLTCSAETAAKIDDEVLTIIKSAHKKAISILKENTDKLHELARYLLNKETITGEEFVEILSRKILKRKGEQVALQAACSLLSLGYLFILENLTTAVKFFCINFSASIPFT
ncbi:hypothetical protein JCM17380_46870 [Desulfosporosinus burensis]